ncbi:MAG: phosphoribosylanthranilate isomerase [Clostridiales bacterium]|nr:phosphoribosylanthranilate isomerase [Clostridiales bacterium]
MKIKICGLSRPEDIEYVNASPPDYAGFVFARSRRQVTPERAAELRAGLSDGIVPVGVFRDESAETVAALYESGVIAAVQLHGDEDAEYIRALRALCGAPVIKAVRVTSAGDAALWDDCGADYLLLDSGGGTGTPFDWSLIGSVVTPYFIAGGVNLGNIDEAAALRPFGVDVSSGAETGGLKDRGKIRELVEYVRRR